MTQNLWHDLSAGDNAPEEIQAIIECPKQSHLKYELDKETGLLRLDRALHSNVHYPGNYGLVPQTYWEDGDPLDIVVLHDSPFQPLTIVNVRPIGVLHMIDNGESDDKIIAVMTDDPRYADIHDLCDLRSHTIKELTNFFETYKLLEGKKVTVEGCEGAEVAKQAVLKSQKLYAEKFGKKQEEPILVEN